jgi:hypothetical protein
LSTEEHRVTVKMSVWRGSALVIAVAVAVIVMSGCGDIVSGSQGSTPGQTESGSGLTGQAKDVSAYLDQVRPIMARVRATISSLSTAAQGTSAKPDHTWQTTARKLDVASQELGREADSLELVTPPESLRPVHEAAVSAIRGTGSAVAQASSLLDKGSSLSGTNNPLLDALVAKLKSLLLKLNEQLLEGTQGLQRSGGAASGS